MPAASATRRNLAVFHSTSTSYIEVHRSVLATALQLARSRSPGFYMTRLTGFDNATAVLAEMLTRSFLHDIMPDLDPVSRAQIAATYRMTLEKRKKLIGKILLAVPVKHSRG